MAQCPICFASADPWINCPIDQKSGRRTSHGSTILCSACDIGSVYPQPSQTEIPSFYDLDRYYTQGQSHFAEAETMFADRVLVKLAWLLDRGSEIGLDDITARFPQPGRACEIGAGAGHFLRKLEQRGWSVVGVEPDPRARSQATGLTIYSGTAEKIPDSIRDDRFELVVMTHTLEHCVDPVAAVRNAASILKPDGRLLIEVPNKDCIHFRTFGAASECFDVPRHLFFFGPKSLRRLVERCGLRVEDEYTHGLTRHHLPSWRATEQRISGYIRANGGDATDHTLVTSVILLAREALAPTADRYDAVGLWAAPPP